MVQTENGRRMHGFPNEVHQIPFRGLPATGGSAEWRMVAGRFLPKTVVCRISLPFFELGLSKKITTSASRVFQ
jgi:hypothetical protein